MLIVNEIYGPIGRSFKDAARLYSSVNLVVLQDALRGVRSGEAIWHFINIHICIDDFKEVQNNLTIELGVSFENELAIKGLVFDGPIYSLRNCLIEMVMLILLVQWAIMLRACEDLVSILFQARRAKLVLRSARNLFGGASGPVAALRAIKI